MAWAWQASGNGQPGLPLLDRGCSGCHGPTLEVPAAGGAVPTRLEICRGSLTDCTVLGEGTEGARGSPQGTLQQGACMPSAGKGGR